MRGTRGRGLISSDWRHRRSRRPLARTPRVGITEEERMDTTRIERELKFLKGYALLMTVVVSIGALAAFKRGVTQVGAIQGTTAKFDVIDVERINVIEPDGKYRLVLSNRPRSIGPIYK